MNVWIARVFLVVAALFSLTPAFAAGSAKPEIVVVYWSSKDCRWCSWWESPQSGMERRFKASEEFKRIEYRVVKNERLADPYKPRDFPPDVLWVYERLRPGEKPPVRPGWEVYVDRKLVAAFYGTKDWDEKKLPALKALITKHSR